jgi:hypothetical protein
LVVVEPSPAAGVPALGAPPTLLLLLPLHATVTTRASAPESARSDDFMAEVYGKISNESMPPITRAVLPCLTAPRLAVNVAAS